MSYANYHTQKLPAPLRYLADLLRYRHLCWNLVGSDLRSRFRRSKLGILWAVLQPLGYSLVIAWAWGAIFHDSDYWGFAIYVFAGMLVWEYFTNTVMVSLEGLMAAVGYLRQSRIPFLVFQARVPLTGLVIFCNGLLGLFILMLVLGRFPMPGQHLLLLPIYIAILPMFMLPLAIIASVVGAQMRDLKHIMTLALQALFFLSPVMMKHEAMDPGRLAFLRHANPIVPLLDMLRDTVMYSKMWDPGDVITVSVWGAILWAVAGVVAMRSGRKIVFAI